MTTHTESSQAQNKAKHTPGTWRALHDTDGDYAIFGPEPGQLLAVTREDTDEDEANANLIAAAPDILIRLKAHVALCPMCSAGIECQDDECYADRAAIAKAEGGAQ